MKIIPVLDLKAGVVVHARHGQREHYLPIQSKLCPSPDIFQVIRAFLTLFEFDTFYIADLDAITGGGDHNALIASVAHQYPLITFWVDQGYCPGKLANSPANVCRVLGSESYTDGMVSELLAFDGNFVLSLDYMGDAPLGAGVLFCDPSYWPETIIIMTLAMVGGNAGPNFAKIGRYCRSYPGKNFIAAGGVRDMQDLLVLRSLGVKQVLVASALHSGKLDGKAIAGLQAKKYPGVRGIF